MELLNTIKWYWHLAALLVQAVFVWLVWSMRKAFVTAEKCAACQKALSGQVEEMDKRQEVAEVKMQGVPSYSDLTEVLKELESVRGDIKEVRAFQEGQQQSLTRIEKQMDMLMDHHMREGK